MNHLKENETPGTDLLLGKLVHNNQLFSIFSLTFRRGQKTLEVVVYQAQIDDMAPCIHKISLLNLLAENYIYLQQSIVMTFAKYYNEFNCLA